MGSHSARNVKEKAHRTSCCNMQQNQRQVPVTAGVSMKCVQTLSSTGRKKEDVLETKVPSEHVNLSENTRTALPTLSRAMKVLSYVCDTISWELNESHGMETGDILFHTYSLFSMILPIMGS